MKKRISVLLCFVFMFLLAGCGEKAKGNDVPETATTIVDNSEVVPVDETKDVIEDIALNPVNTADTVGSLKIYSEKPDGTWECEGNTYKYKLEITGRMNNAECDSTFVYLSNMEEITFEQAWKAAGFSSDSNDYFDVKQAVLVDLITEE